MYFETGPRDQDKYVYPEAVQVLGWILELSPTIVTLVYPIWVIHRWVIVRFTAQDLLHLFAVF